MTQFVVGIGLFSHQAGNLETGVGDIAQDVQIAILAAGALAVIHLVQFLAQVSAVAIFHERAITGGIQRHQPCILTTLVPGRLPGGIKGALGQTCQVIGGEPQFIAGRFLEGILVKLQRQLGQALGQVAVTVAVGTLQIGTAAHKAVIGFLHQHPVLCIMA